MVPIRENLCSPSMYYCKCPYITDKDGICVHNTGMPSPARNEINYMINNYNEVSFHTAIDESEIVIGIPYDRNVWASGDGHGNGNMHKIHIEICRSTNENESLFDQAEKNAAEYIASLLKEYGWGINRVFKHQDFDGKYCPHKTLDRGWTRFLNMIKSYYNSEESEEDDEMLSYEQFKAYMEKYNNEVGAKPVPEWGKDAWKDVCDNKILDGSRPESPVRRVELALVLDRLNKEDLPVSDWAKEAWDQCVEAGLLDGTKPVSPLTRQEFAVVLDRLNKMISDDTDEDK